MLLPPKAVHHADTTLREDASFYQVAIGDSNLSGIEKGPRQTGVI
jgi:hypothetical protein